MKKSAGILAYRRKHGLEVLLVHPGGPFFRNKDAGSWSIPKGEYTSDEEPLLAARREFFEETGHELHGVFLELTPVTQKSGKTVIAWAIEFDLDATSIRSNTFQMEWPPRSGRFQVFPEVDEANWFNVNDAKKKINPAQAVMIDELAAKLKIKI